MKVIHLGEAKAHLSKYERLCHEEPVIITISGVPSFRLAPLEEGDQLIDELIEHNSEFRGILDARLREPAASVKTVLRSKALRLH